MEQAVRQLIVPRKATLPARDVRDFRARLNEVLAERDAEGRQWGDAKWGIYAFYDYDGEPIYVGQTNEKLRTRIRRHLTNQRTDAVAMRILDPFEVAEIEMWPLWHLPENASNPKEARAALDAAEYSAYLQAIERSRFSAILNEKIPPVSPRVALPPSLRRDLIDTATRMEREHPDIRVSRRAETISRLADVVRERGEVSPGMRRVLVIQAVRLAYLSAERLAYSEGRPAPDPAVLNVQGLVGSVLEESSDTPVDEG
jgi:GIY-YIG catalytic domain